MKRLASICLAVLAVFLLCLPALGADYLSESMGPSRKPLSRAVYLYNLDTGKEIYTENPDEPIQPASLVKIMTCILALENVPDPDTTYLTYPTYVQDYLYNYQLTQGGVSLAGMYAGEEMALADLLYGLMLPSGNEVAMIIADYVGGQGGAREFDAQAAFVELMNKRAKELGAVNTNFVNANGLYDAQQYTTARDMAILTQHALTLPRFGDIAAEFTYAVGPTNKNPGGLTWNSTILMQTPTSVEHYYPYLSGVKTGTLPESGRNFVSTATRDGFTYLLVTLGGPIQDDAGNETRSDFQDHYAIYEWAFNNFKVKSLVEKNTVVGTVPLRLNAEKDVLQLVTAERYTALVAVDVNPASSVMKVLHVPESVDAPVKKGDVIGTMDLMLYGEMVGTVDLLAYESVSASQLLVLWEQVKALVGSFWFKFAIIFVVLLIILYIVLMILRNKRRRRQKRTLYKPRRRI